MSNARAGTPIPDDSSNPNTPTTPQVAAPIVVADNRVLSREQLIAIRTKFYQHGHTARTLYHRHYHRSELDAMLVRDTGRTQSRKAEVEKEREREREMLHYGQLQKLLDKQRKLVQASLDSVKSRPTTSTRDRTVTTGPADNTATPATITTTTPTTTKDQPTKQRAKPLTRSAPRSPYLLNTPDEEPTTQPTTAPEAVKDNNPGDVASTPVAPRRRGKPLTRSAARSPYLLESALEEDSVAASVKFEGGTAVAETTQQQADATKKLAITSLAKPLRRTESVANIEDTAPASVPSLLEASRRRAKPLTRSAPKSPYLLESPISEPAAVTTVNVAVKVAHEASMVIPEMTQQTAQPQAQLQAQAPKKIAAKPLARTESVANLEDPATTTVPVAPQRRAKPLTRSAPPSPYLLRTPTEENSKIAGQSEVSTTSSQQQPEASAQAQPASRTSSVQPDNVMGPPVIPQGRAKSLKRSASMISTSVDDSDSGSSSTSTPSSSTTSSSESKSDYPPPSKSRKIREGPYSKNPARKSRRTEKKEVTDTDEPKPTPIPEDYLNRFWPSVESHLNNIKSTTSNCESYSPSNSSSKPISRTGIIKATDIKATDSIKAAEPELERGFYVYRPGYGNWFKVFIPEHEFYEDPDEYDVRYIFPNGYTEKEREVVRRREYVVVMKGTGRYVACANPVEEEE